MAIQIYFSELVRRVDSLGNLKGPEFNLEKGFRAMVDRLTRFSKRVHNYKNRSGALSKSLKAVHNSTIGTELKSSIESNVNYASFIYEGTKDHFIRPNKAKALSWVHGGSRVFSKGHKVRGIKKEEWIENNYITRQSFWNDILVKEALK